MPSFMSSRFLTVAAALATATAAHATTINGSYTAVDTTPGYTTSDGAPTINTVGGYLASPLPAEALTVGNATTPTPFLEVSPTNWPTNSQGHPTGSGTVTGSITVNLTLTDQLPAIGSSVTGVSSSAGGYVASLITGGVVQVIANYAIDYANQTDCISWTVAACTLPSSQGTDTTNILGDTIAVTFGDHAVLDVNLYNWSDWTMAPRISFDLVSGPTTGVPEPMSIALLGVGMIGIRAVRRRRAQALQATA
jgi:hypothetical protein